MKNTINQFDPSRARVALMRMLSELSVDALEYVLRPIIYAYYWTDDRNQDWLTDDDLNRVSLISAAAHDSPDLVRTLSATGRWIRQMEREESRTKA